MLRQADRKDAQSDVQSLGAMMIECLEPHTALSDGQVLVQDKWDSTLCEFQALTNERTAGELLQVCVYLSVLHQSYSLTNSHSMISFRGRLVLHASSGTYAPPVSRRQRMLRYRRIGQAASEHGSS